MCFRALISIFVLIAGISLAVKTSPQIASGATPESRDQTAAPAVPLADLSRKNILILHTLSANVPANIKADQGLRTTLEKAGLEVYRVDASEYARWQEAAIPVINQWTDEREAEGLPGKEFIDLIRKIAKRYS